jgi:phosphate-selective porin OprO and OprP
MPLKPCPFPLSRPLWLLCLCLALPAAAGEGGETDRTPKPSPPAAQPMPITASAPGLSAVRLSMLLHTDLRIPRHGSTPGTTVLLRRARLQLDSTLAEWIDARLILGDLLSSGSQPIKDAWLDFRFAPWLQLRVGRLKTPFSYEWLMTSSNQLDFVESSLVFQGLVPQYTQGAVLHGKAWTGQAEYWVGYVNGGKKTDNTSEGPDERMWVARLSASPLKGLLLGASATHSVGSRSEPWALSWRSPTGYELAGQAPKKVQPPRSRLGVEATFRRGPVSLKSEYIYLDALGETADPGGEARGLWAQGFYATAGWVVTGEDKTEKGVSPERPFEPLEGRLGPGAWELGARYGFLEWGVSVDGQPKVKLQEATLGLSWYPNANTRWMVNGSRYAQGAGADALLKHSSFYEVLARMQLFF